MAKKMKVRATKQMFVNSMARAWPKLPSLEESIKKDYERTQSKNGKPG